MECKLYTHNSISCTCLIGASLVKGIPFNPSDPDISGPDIFQRLVPMEAHEASSLYRWMQFLFITRKARDNQNITDSHKPLYIILTYDEQWGVGLWQIDRIHCEIITLQRNLHQFLFQWGKSKVIEACRMSDWRQEHWVKVIFFYGSLHLVLHVIYHFMSGSLILKLP